MIVDFTHWGSVRNFVFVSRFISVVISTEPGESASQRYQRNAQCTKRSRMARYSLTMLHLARTLPKNRTEA